ncbi:MAG: alkaline shock response membrane anchor protein AmaP, partial [Candidatus Omnitrophica bacterium]|nr:alkaline shock response membrane anchor protein AmaP [Candidatus Omnitrophota bacterium]
MRFFSVLGVLFYSAVITLIGIVLIIFSLNFILPQDINHLLVLAKDSNQTRIILGLSGCLLILISYSFAQLILGKIQRERTIAFTTAGGQVTISLSAVEDLIRRLAVVIPEIRDIKPDVVATKKGIIV